MTEYDRVSIGRRNTPEGENVVFIRGTEILTEIPIKTIRRVAELVAEFQGISRGCTVTFTEDDTYELRVSSWDGSDIMVTLYDLEATTPLGTWDLIEIDPF